MRTAIFFIILLVFLAFLLAGCVIQQPPATEKTPLRPTTLPALPALSAEQGVSDFDPLARCRNLPYAQQQDCIAEVAVQGAYPSLCDELDAKNRTKCLLDTAIKALNSDYCQGIQHSATRNSCYKTIALLTKKAAPCGFLSALSDQDLFSKNDCYDDVAEKTQDATACANITEEAINQPDFQFHRDKCYWQVFAQTKDSSLCSKFLDSAKAAACAQQASQTPDSA